MKPADLNIGELVRVIDAADQPGWTRMLVGKTGIIVDRGLPGEIPVLIDGKVLGVLHPLDLEKVDDDR